MTTIQLPKDFFLGVATAAAQVEGAAFEDGKGPSIWDTMCREEGRIDDSSNIDVACDHYHRVDEDVQLISSLGVSTYRFSISWARVMPDGRSVNQKGLEFYAALLDKLNAAGIQPWVTLYHWDLPQALQDEGGWANRQTASLFAEYARVVYSALGERANVWTTLNEPWCASFLSYVCGEHAPGHTSPDEGVAAAHHLLLAHGLATAQIRRLARQKGLHPKVGITLNFSWAHPANPDSAADRDAARRVNGAQNRIFADPLFLGAYPPDVVADMALEADIMKYVREGDLQIISAPIDVLGINFYNGSQVAAPSEGYKPASPQRNARGVLGRSPIVGSASVVPVARHTPHTAMGWEVKASDLYELLVWLNSEYARPFDTEMVITENGAAFDDVPDRTGYVDDSKDRLVYLRDHLAAALRARSEGVNLKGYLVWSLLDNFEWARGYTKRFGIVRVDYGTMQRVPKASAHWLAKVAANRNFEAPEP
ncbi:MAG: family 1 glycosylhydrolase [Winkia neuii]|uniref:beta-glucosidase n=1 Tax=Winkia neuii TaxID=33007 RepID=A0A2I1INB7_9ACTO|nr:family 1 glycosylhydrolase [Winkia neuii]OFJ71842.1 beta-galactosidase [Actinomyces sp. HMSC064C12]OFK01023.1 beta-galactosidase [Actinomyces sp. HMSC072A03]OFT55955.1 beta-galactosidase [Actinomyces sp. HMSC06A08]KWZ72865.1 beta-galactosidase [Winkia neuii]MDK8099159.1 family 1 glycosylhydrolase [Winkia neuii]